MIPVLQSAISYLGAGLSVIPVRADGSKAPACKWGEYQRRLATESELVEWFTNYRRGIAIIGGAVSGNLEILDFDMPELLPAWFELIEESEPGLFEHMPLVRTPSGGAHLYYRCEEIEGNQKLAQLILDDGELKTGIETRGTGGYVLASGSPACCHVSGREYELIAGSLTDIPVITPEQRRAMFRAARTFNQYTPAPFSLPTTDHRPPTTANRPGDDYNERGDWHSLLIPHGWSYCGSRGDVGLWRRPNKSDGSISATTNNGGTNHLYVFSSNCAPFEHERSYSLFSALALLEFGGDWRAASAALRARGYGVERPRISLSDYRPPRKPETIRLPEPQRPATIRYPEPTRPQTIRLPEPTRPRTERI